MSTEQIAEMISHSFARAYFYCHPTFEIELSHQAVRALQFAQICGPTTIQEIAQHLGCAQNTASEIVRRLRHKGLVEKRRHSDDERAVEVHLTDAGRRAVLQHTGLDVEYLSVKLEKVSEADRDRIEQGLSLLLKAVGGEGE